MSYFEDDLTALLSGDADLAALTGGRVSWFKREDHETAAPYITLLPVSDDPMSDAINGRHRVFETLVQIDLYCPEHAQALQGRKALFALLLPSWRAEGDGPLRSILVEGGASSIDISPDSADLIRFRLDVLCHWDTRK